MGGDFTWQEFSPLPKDLSSFLSSPSDGALKPPRKLGRGSSRIRRAQHNSRQKVGKAPSHAYRPTAQNLGEMGVGASKATDDKTHPDRDGAIGAHSSSADRFKITPRV